LARTISIPKKFHQTIIEPSRRWSFFRWKELWAFRELLWMLTMREIKLRYRQTILGVAWVILQPLLTTAIFTVIFGVLMKTPSENVNYTLFAFVGLLPWNVFSASLQRAGVSLTRDIRLITRIYFPRIIIPISNSLATMVDFLVSFALMFILLIIYKTPLSWNILIIPVLLFFNMLLSIGVGISFAALNVYYRDFSYILPFIIQIWMYASPLAYSAKLIPSSWTWVYDLNPLVGIINGFRWAVYGTIDFPLNSLLYSIIASTVIFIFGWIIFRRLERNFADVI
jgi:lipopolysaccharide transport system permease protein